MLPSFSLSFNLLPSSFFKKIIYLLLPLSHIFSSTIFFLSTTLHLRFPFLLRPISYSPNLSLSVLLSTEHWRKFHLLLAASCSIVLFFYRRCQCYRCCWCCCIDHVVNTVPLMNIFYLLPAANHFVDAIFFYYPTEHHILSVGRSLPCRTFVLFLFFFFTTHYHCLALYFCYLLSNLSVNDILIFINHMTLLNTPHQWPAPCLTWPCTRKTRQRVAITQEAGYHQWLMVDTIHPALCSLFYRYLNGRTCTIVAHKPAWRKQLVVSITNDLPRGNRRSHASPICTHMSVSPMIDMFVLLTNALRTRKCFALSFFSCRAPPQCSASAAYLTFAQIYVLFPLDHPHPMLSHFAPRRGTP